MPETPDRAPARSDRDAALIAAAATDDLIAEDRRAYDALTAADGTVAPETAALRVTLDRVGGLPGWDDSLPSHGLAARVLGVGETAATAPRAWRPDRLLPATAAAAVLLVVGGVAGAAVTGGLSDDEPPAGPPGTLGAVESIDFRGAPEDVRIEASVVAHTWGTETLLDMDGWTPGESFRVVLVGTDGKRQGSGTFVGSEVAIDCRMNGALLREQVDVIEIRDRANRVVASSDVPHVTSG